MRIKDLHSWNLSYSEAADLQKKLARKVKFTPIRKQPGLIAGLDCAFSKDGQRIVAAAVVLRNQTSQKGIGSPLEPPCTKVIPAQAGIHFEIVETTSAVQKVSFPYIPGLLSFREAPVCLASVEKLKQEPDAFIIDGQGIAHPRRLGLAAHLGLFFDKPTIGCAKSKLTGTFEAPQPEKGSFTLLRDKKSSTLDTSNKSRATSNEVIGAVVRTRTNVKPIFVSVGNKCLLKDAIKITLDCTTKYRLPEPTRLAHQLVSKLRLKV